MIIPITIKAHAINIKLLLIAFSIIIAVGIIVDLILIRLKGVQLEDIKVSIDIPKEEVKEEQPKE